MTRARPYLPRHLIRVLGASVTALACAASLLVLAPGSPAVAATGAAVTSAASGRCLDVKGNLGAPGTPTIIWNCNGQPNQRWSLDSVGRLLTLDDTRCLVPSGSARGSAAVTATCTSGTGQAWRYTTAGTLVHVATGWCLDVSSAATAAGTPVIVWSCNGQANQRWSRPAGVPDVQPPSAPAGLRSYSLACRSVTLSWTAATDDVGVSAYDLFHDGQLVTSVPGSTLTATVAVVPGVSWGWYVNARDAAGNVSQASPSLTVTPPQCSVDSVPPTRPTSVTATADGTSVTVRWTASTDDVGVTAYDVLRDGVTAGTVTGGTSFTDSGLAARRTYSYTVVARDAQGNVSPPSTAVTVTTGSVCSSALCAVREVTTDTDIPWGLVTLPDGQVLYSRRDAHDIVTMNSTTGVKRSIGTVPGVSSTDGEGGLMGLAVGPQFSTDRWLYIMHTTATDNRVVRIRYSGSSLDTATTQPLVTGILRNKFHNGGRLRFGPDGMLYAATGDAQNGNYSQALTGTGALNGKILRMTPTGGIPSDNPFGSLVWSLGHRNPQGLAFDDSGRLWQQEFGNSVMDETNLVVRGGNYGWPQCEGTASLSGSGCGGAGLVAPKATYATSAGSCSGLTAVEDALWVACGRGSRLYRWAISGTSLTDQRQLLTGTYGRLRTVEPAADGGLWLTTTNLGDKDSVANNSNEKILHLTVGTPTA